MEEETYLIQTLSTKNQSIIHEEEDHYLPKECYVKPSSSNTPVDSLDEDFDRKTKEPSSDAPKDSDLNKDSFSFDSSPQMSNQNQKRKREQLEMIKSLDDEEIPLLGDQSRKLVKVSKNIQDSNLQISTSYSPISMSSSKIIQIEKATPQIYDADEISKVFTSLKDVSIVQNDIPERYQLYLGNFIEKELSDEDLIYLVNWIHMKIEEDPQAEQVNSTIIRDIIILIMKQKMEVLTIWNSHRNFIPNISLESLWRILNLLISFKEDIHYPRSRQEDVTIEMYSIKQISNVVLRFMNSAHSKKDFQDLQMYFNYQKCCYDLKTRNMSDLFQGHLKIINKAREFNFPQTIFLIFEESTNTAERLMPDDKSINDSFEKGSYLHNNSEKILPNSEEEILAALFKIPLNPSEKQNMQELIQDYISLDFLYNPIIKKYILESYFENAVLSTSPLSNVIDFTLYHEFFLAKKIHLKPLKEIKNDEYLIIKQAVQQNLIECRISLMWQSDNSSDLIYQHLLPIFQAHIQEISPGLKQYVENLLKKLLNNFLYPTAQSEMVRILEEKSLNQVKEICVSKFREYISYGPFKAKDKLDNLAKPDTILSFFVNETTGMIGVSMINSLGKEVYKNSFEYFFNSQPAFKEKRDVELKNLYDFIRNRQPYVICISSNCSGAIVLKSNLSQQFKRSQKVQSVKERSIYLAQKQAKCLQNRLAEVCALWSEDANPVLDFEFHPFQKKVDKRQLQIRFEQVLQERICKEGIQLRSIADLSQLQGQLQFLPGFGSRKAYYLSTRIGSLSNSKDITSRHLLVNMNWMGQNLQTNCLGFILFSHSDNPLDSTKIAFEQYFVLQAIAERCQENKLKECPSDPNPEEFERIKQKSISDCFKQILNEPSLMYSIDLYDYAKYLEILFSRGNMIVALDCIIDELKRSSKKNNDCLPVSPCPTLQDIFESVYKVGPSLLRKGIVLQFQFREDNDKYIEFNSKEYKFRAHLLKSEIPKNLGIDRWVQKRKNAVVELVLNSVRAFDNPQESQNQTELIFENTLSLEYPHYEEIANTLFPQLKESNKYWTALDQSDYPSTKDDLSTQFNVFNKEMLQNPNSVIDLTEDNPYHKFAAKNVSVEVQGNQWGNPQQKEPLKENNSDGNGWNNNSNNNRNNDKQPLRQGPRQDDQRDGFKKPYNKPSSGNNNNSSSDASNSDWGASTPQWGKENTEIKPQQQSSSSSNAAWGVSNNSSSEWGASNQQNSLPSSSTTSSAWGASSASSTTTPPPTASSSSASSAWGASSSSTNPASSSSSSSAWGVSQDQSSVPAASSGWGAKETTQTGNSSSAWGASQDGGGCSWGNNQSSDSGASSGGGNTWNSGGSGGNGSEGNGQRGRDFSQRRPGGGDRQGGGGQGRACFKCGKEGHMSRECTESGSQNSGGGGQSRACFKCGKEGHMSRDCTEAGSQNQGKRQGGGASGTCFKCNEEGHMSRECPSAPKKGCFKCGEEGHMSKECPSAPKRGSGCFKCGEEGHMSRECTQPQANRQNGGGGGSSNQTPFKCFKCNEEGHMSRECTNPNAPQQRKRSCFNCGDENHMSKDCTQERKERPPRNNQSNRNSSFGGDSNQNGGGNSWGGSSGGNFGGSSTAWNSVAQESTGWGGSSNNSTNQGSTEKGSSDLWGAHPSRQIEKANEPPSNGGGGSAWGNTSNNGW